MKKIAIFASGAGSNAENIIRYFDGSPAVSVSVVISNRSNAGVCERVKAWGIPVVHISKFDFSNSKKVLSLLRHYGVDVIVLAGFLLLVPVYLLKAYPERIINIHPALLPKFGGKGMYGAKIHEAVVAQGEKETGITIHLIDKHYDGGKILLQQRCPVSLQDTPVDVAMRVHALEYEYYPQVIEIFCEEGGF